MSDALHALLDSCVAARGTAAVAVVPRPGAEPLRAWTPALPEEPAFLAYSITKTVLAVLVLQLRDEGRLDLDDPVTRFVPRAGTGEDVTLRRLLRHEAGVPDYGGLPAYHEAVRDPEGTPWDADRFLAETLDRGLLFRPGAGWAYSNPGYLLLKLAVETVARTGLRRLFAERIARPLRMVRSQVAQDRSDLVGLVAGPSRQLGPPGGPGRDLRRAYHPGWVSHGVVASTPSEIARFLDALFRGRLVSEVSLEEMRETVEVPRPADGDQPWRRPSYGLGLMVDPDARWGGILGHEGAGPGHQASAFHAPGLGGVTACAMGAIEADWAPRSLVFGAFDERMGVRAEHAVR